ncbi:MAG: sugar ABC transporter permease, partial [Candidatus Bathyarchaeia archaeon]
LMKITGKGREALNGYLLLIPAFGLLAALLIYPIFYAAWMSFHSKIFGGPAIYVGLKNYVDILFDPEFYNSFLRSFIYTFGAVSFKLIIGLLVGILLNREFKMRRIVRSTVILPWVIPLFVVAFIWMWMYDYALGLLNNALKAAGLPVVYWLSRDNAMTSLIVVNIWRGFPFFAMGILSGLQSVPQDLLDAAAVDGASAFQRFRHVILPWIMPVIGIVSLLSMIWTFGDFTTVWLLTRGGPGKASTTIPIYLYYIVYAEFDTGKASAASILTLPFSIFFIYLIVRLLRRAQE